MFYYVFCTEEKRLGLFNFMQEHKLPVRLKKKLLSSMEVLWERELYEQKTNWHTLKHDLNPEIAAETIMQYVV
jgi:hypothetical protein